ncbi:MAG: hypothetical protein AAGA50_20950 [Pseudomonadota bacterium]
MVIFTGTSTLDHGRFLVQQAQAKINNLTEEKLLSVSEVDFAQEIIDELIPQIPKIDRENISKDRGSGNSGRNFGETTHYYELFIPFTGAGEAFNYSPSRSTLGGIQLSVIGSELVFRASATDQKAEERLNALLNDVEEHLRTMEQDFVGVSTQIRQMVTKLLPKKRQDLEAAVEGLNRLNFKVRRRDNVPSTYAVPSVKRKAVPSRRNKSAVSTVPEPTLDEAEYQHIMNVMDNMTHVMERSPKAFDTLGEEDIRTHFLFQLNGQYEGQATGETFNYSGKTDILIRVEDKNIFIAECKFWRGEQSLLKTIDQLLGYLSWRDAKTALVVFNPNKNFSEMINTAVEAVKAHSNYKSGPSKEAETRYRYVMKSKSDPEKEIIMTMMLFDVPR